MKKLDYKTLAISTAVCLLPLVAGLLLWDSLPDRIPMHWNFAGEIDRYGSKAMGVLFLPGFMAAINLLLHFVLRADPRSDNMPRVLTGISYWIIPVMSVVLGAATLLVSMGIPVRVEVIIPLLIGVLFIAIGNYLPKCRQNYSMGIRTPWSLNSDENWSRTHRIGGYCFTVAGLLLMLCALPGCWWLFFPAIVLCSVVPMAYSYVLYRKGI